MSMIKKEKYPAKYESELTLKNGITVFVRPVRETDKNLILDLFDRLKPDSIYMRFLSRLGTFPESLLFKLTHIDYVNQFALAALIKEDDKESFIAVARYSHESGDDVTDFAVAVRDDWQGLGLGKSLLLKLLMIGKGNGFHRFASVASSSNRIMKNLVRSLDYPVKYSNKTGATQIEIIIP